MTIEELKEHCIKTIKMGEAIESIPNVKITDSRSLQEHKMVLKLIETLEQKEKIIHCKDCKYRDYWGDCNKWSKELDAHKTYLLDENMFCGFAEIGEGKKR